MVSRIGVHDSVGVLFPPSHLRDAIAGAGPTVEVVETDEVAACDALVTFTYDDAFLAADLEWIHSIQAGVDRFPFDELRDRGISLTNSTGVHGDAVGEMAVGYMLQFARRLHVYRDGQSDGSWNRPEWDEPFTIAGESLCVVGLGTLGRGIANRGAVLGMDVVGVKRTPVPVDFVSTVYPTDRLHEAIADARFVAAAVPLTEQTEGLIGTEEIAAMRDDAYLINVARGGVVDEAALLDALEADALAGAAIDVFETEPLPADSRFWDREDVIVTPHTAGSTVEYGERVAAIVRENARRLAAGESLANAVV